MNITQKLIFTSCLSFSLPVFATVGGPQSIEVLGYEAKEQKVYLLKHYEDGRDRLPQLYYYQFKNNAHPNKLIQVNSLYINPKTQKVDYDQDDTHFKKELTKIKKRLQPLPTTHAKYHIAVNQKTVQRVPTWYDPKQKQSEFHYTYTVKNQNFKSQQQQATAYQEKLKITQQFMIPQQNKVLVTVQYLGIPYETGYMIEDPVLLLPKK